MSCRHEYISSLTGSKTYGSLFDDQALQCDCPHFPACQKQQAPRTAVIGSARDLFPLTLSDGNDQVDCF